MRPKGSPRNKRSDVALSGGLGRGCRPLPNLWLHPNGMFPYCFVETDYVLGLLNKMLSWFTN
jgi:hypothetical protein